MRVKIGTKEITLKYSSSEARDAHGRWTAGGAAGAVQGGLKKYWNKTHTVRHAEGAAAAGALSGLSQHKKGEAISHGVLGLLSRDNNQLSHAATSAVVSHYAGRASDAIMNKVDKNPRNEKIFSGSKFVTRLALNRGVQNAARGAGKFGKGAVRGARQGLSNRRAVSAGRQYAGSNLGNSKTRFVDQAWRTSTKAAGDIPPKPIIQIAMEMKKHMAAQRGKKVKAPFKPSVLNAAPLQGFKKPNWPKAPVAPVVPPVKPAATKPAQNLHFPLNAKPVAKKTKTKAVTHRPSGIVAAAKTDLRPQLLRRKEMSATQFVFKDANDNYRWVLLSSNGFRDRDGEIVSTKALERDVAMWELMDHPYQPLRFWHIPLTDDYSRGLEIGDTDFRVVHGHTLIESGTFIDPVVGKAVYDAQDQLAASVGFRHSLNEPNSDKIFNAVQIFERSLLPRDKASNPLTHLIVQ